MALKSCLEIGSSKTLYAFIMDVLTMTKSIYGSNSEYHIPNQKWQTYLQQTNKEDNRKFVGFLKSVIICTEGIIGSQVQSECVIEKHEQEQQERLARVLKQGYYLKHKETYLELLTDVVSELLNEDKKQHLQTYGYGLEKSIPDV